MIKEKLKEKENKMKRILLSILPMIMLFIGCDVNLLSWTSDSEFNPYSRAVPTPTQDNHNDYKYPSYLSHTETITETFINGHGNWTVKGTITNNETVYESMDIYETDET